MPDRPAPPTRLDRAALVRWLGEPQVVDPKGRVWSWHNPAHPGYPYPEAAGLWLAVMAREPQVPLEALGRVGAWLDTCQQQNTLGRDGRSYLFDRGMVLAGRLAWADRRGLSAAEDTASTQLVEGLLADLQTRRVTAPPCPADRWSTRFGPHLLKLALPLAAWARREHPPQTHDALAALLEAPGVRQDPEGRVLDETGPTYLHAHCYAAEGLWGLSTALPEPLAQRAAESATRAAAWLAHVQRPDGGLPPWHDGTRGWGPAPADVAAQAIRLWCGLGRERFAHAIDRALGFLGSLHRPGQGLRYHEHSDDQNTWATLFAVQAIDFAGGEADVHRLV